MANSNAASVPISIPMVTIPAGLHLLMKDLNTAEAANVEKAVDAVYKKCSEHSNADLVTVRKAFIDSGTLGTYVKIGKRCMDNVKIQTTMAATVRLLIAPPAKGKTDVADALRRSLLEATYAQMCAEIISKYADQPGLVEHCALNVQHLFNNPSSWDVMQAAVFQLVTPLVTAVSKSSASATAVASCIETLAFIAHVDLIKRNGEWNVVAKLADVDMWNILTNTVLGKHGRSGRVAAAVMTLLHKSAASPKAGNFLRGISNAGLVTTAISYMRRSLVIPTTTNDYNDNDRSVSPVRGRTRSPSSRPGTAASRPGTAASRPQTSSSTIRSMHTMTTTFSATKTLSSSSMGHSASSVSHNNTNANPHSSSTLRLRTYAEQAWNFVREVADKLPEVLLTGEPLTMARLLLEPLLTPDTYLSHVKLSLGVLGHLVHTDVFLAPFLNVGGAAVITALTRTLVSMDYQAAFLSANVMLSMVDIPSASSIVLNAGGLEALLECYFLAGRVLAPSVATETLMNYADGILRIASTSPGATTGLHPPETTAPVTNTNGSNGVPTEATPTESSSSTVDAADPVYDPRRRIVAAAVVDALTVRKGDTQPHRLVLAAAHFINWSKGAHDILVALVHADAVGSICNAMRAFPLRDEILGPLINDLYTLLPCNFVNGAWIIPEASPYVQNGGNVIQGLFDMLRFAVKRETTPNMEVWTSLFALLETLIYVSGNNRTSFLKLNGLLPYLSSALEWSLNVCDAESYKVWRLATRPPPVDEDKHHHKNGKGGKKSNKKGTNSKGNNANDANEIQLPTEVPPQWIPPRIIRLFMVMVGNNSTALHPSPGAIRLREAFIHRKVAEYIWPWVCTLIDNEELTEPEIDNGIIKQFLDTVWKVGADGPYLGWEAYASKEEIKAAMKKFPSWKPDPSYL